MSFAVVQHLFVRESEIVWPGIAERDAVVDRRKESSGRMHVRFLVPLVKTRDFGMTPRVNDAARRVRRRELNWMDCESAA